MRENLFADIPLQLPEELVQTLIESDGVRIERIVSRGHTSPEDFWFDQDRPEWVMVLRGRARVRFAAGADRELEPGDYLHIDAHQLHRVEWTQPDEDTVWLAVHYRAG